MWSFKEIAKTGLSINAIYNCRNTPLGISILFFLIINMGFSFPFVFGVLSLQQIQVDKFLDPAVLESFEDSKELDFLKTMAIKEGRLIQSGYEEQRIVNIGPYVLLYDYYDNFVPQNSETAFTVRLSKDYMEIKFGMNLYSDYQSFEEMELSEMDNTALLNYFFVSGLKGAIPQWIMPITILFYLAFLLINTLFVLGVSGFAMLFRIMDHVKLSYKETFNIIVFSTVMPTILAAIVGLGFNLLGLNVFIYNLGTLIVYMFVRKKFLKNAPRESE